MAKSKPISDQLREAIDRSCHTRYRISKATDIAESNLCHFMKGRAGLSLDSVDRLCSFLNLNLTEAKTKSK